MDYLMEEVFQKQPPELRDFLMKTSVLERLAAPLCDLVTGRTDGSDVLLNLERGHLFVVPLDESRQSYRYEYLFADLLRHRCQTVCGKQQVAALHRRASQWYEDSGLPDEALFDPDFGPRPRITSVFSSMADRRLVRRGPALHCRVRER
jgi:LuxR family maltose regulon positive regulatory protein